MFHKLIFTLLLFITYSFADFRNLTPTKLQSMIDQNIIVIDIRTPPEWLQTGVIPTSNKIMFFNEKGDYDIKSWLKYFGRIIKTKEQPFVLVCRSGNRTTQVGNFLSEKLKFKNVYHLKNGIKSWIKENRKTTK